MQVICTKASSHTIYFCYIITTISSGKLSKKRKIYIHIWNTEKVLFTDFKFLQKSENEWMNIFSPHTHTRFPLYRYLLIFTVLFVYCLMLLLLFSTCFCEATWKISNAHIAFWIILAKYSCCCCWNSLSLSR